MIQDTAFLGQERIGPLLFRLSLPGVVGMLVHASYNVVDTLFIGWGVGALGLAGSAVAFPILMVVMALTAWGGVGASSLISRSLGEGNPGRAEGALGNLVTLSLLLGLATLVLGLGALNPLLRLLKTAPEVQPYAEEYTRILFYGTPLLFTGVGLNYSLRAEGKARLAMTSMLVSAAVNLILDPLFLFVFRWGIAGAAWATVIAQGTVVVWLGYVYLTGRTALRIRPGHLRLRGDLLREILEVGLSEGARLGANGLMIGLAVRALGVYGSSTAVAAYGIISRVLSLLFMPLIGLAQGLQPVLGFNYGAGLYQRARKATLISAQGATLFSGLGWLILLAAPGPILRLFSSEPGLLALGEPMMRTMTLGFFCVGFQTVGAATFQALGKARPALLLSLARQVLLLIPLLVLLPPFFGLLGVWISFPLADLFSTLLTGAFFLSEMRFLKGRETALPSTP